MKGKKAPYLAGAILFLLPFEMSLFHARPALAQKQKAAVPRKDSRPASPAQSRAAESDPAPRSDARRNRTRLLEAAREVMREQIERVLTEPCPYCAGSSVIKSSSTICYEILAEVKKISGDLDGQSLMLRVNPDIARALREEERAVLKELKQTVGRDVILKSDVQLHHEQFDLMAIG